MHSYREDLAYVHDAGHSEYALNAAPGLIQILKKAGIRGGLVVDLGCGSGRLAGELNHAGYDVLGIDQSPAMIRLARQNAPSSRFKIAPLDKVDLRGCAAVVSTGECLNYSFEDSSDRSGLMKLFRTIFRALPRGGAFVFDIAEPSRAPGGTPQKYWKEGPGWAVMSTTTSENGKLRRWITCFRRVGKNYRRSEEIHDLQLYRATDLLGDLKRCGFEAKAVSGFGRFRLPKGIRGIVAVKP